MANQKPNFFDQFDGEPAPVDVPAFSGEMTQGPRPTLLERFRANADAGFRYNTLLGASADTLDPEGRARFDRQYEAMPQWDGLLEGAAALAGQFVGSAGTPESFIPIGVGSRVAAGAGLRASSLSARILAGAVDASIVNAVTDAGIQRIEIGAGFRETFDPMQWAMGVGLGAAIGGALPAAGAGARVVGDKVADAIDRRLAAKEEPAPAPVAGEPGAAAPTAGAIDEAAPAASEPAAPGPDSAAATDAVPDPGLTIVNELPPADGAPMDVTVTPEPAAPEPAPTAGEEIAARVDAILTAGEVPDPLMGVDVPSATADEIRALPQPGNPDLPVGPVMVDPTALKVDAEQFQFKSQGDAEGVTDALKGITKWRPERANQIIVWQNKAGELYVVDGHQRSGLARRLVADGYERAIRVPAVVFREADGWTADMAMMQAAYKNIAEGSASTVDAAKILRAGGDDQDLPMSRDGIRQARDLAKLSDEAWRYVVNEQVDPQYARFVGQVLADDPTRQVAAMNLFVKSPPDNVNQAAIAVRRVRDAEVTRREAGAQTDMFGGAIDSAVMEESRIVAEAIKVLRRDKALFARLTKDADRIEEGGSKVDRDRAGAIVDEADKAAAYVEKLAFRAGPIRDMVKALSKEVANGETRLNEAAERLADGIRRGEGALPDGGAPRRGDGGKSELAGAKAERKPEPAKPEPATERTAIGDQGLIPGVKAVTDADRIALEAARPMRGGNRDLPADGLFGDAKDQTSLFRMKPMTSAAAGATPGRAAGGTAGPTPAMTRLSEVSDRLVEGLNVTVRDGRVKAGALGTYGTTTGVVRVRAVGDFATLTHELGHAIEYKYPATVRPLMMRHQGELMPLAYDPNAKTSIRLQEGFAEFMRLLVTNPAHAAKQAPGFDAAFRQAMPAPEMALLDDTARAYADWLAQPSDIAVASTIRSNKRPGWLARTADDLRRHGLAGTIADRVSQAYQLLFDDLSPISRAVRALARVHVDKTGQMIDLKVSEDAYKLARMARGAHTIGHMDIMHGVHGYYSALPETPSLRDAIIKASGKPNVFGRWDDAVLTDFGAYLWSRRALGEWERFKAGDIPNPPDKLTEGDHAQAVKDFEARYPTFADAAPQVHDWAHGLWRKKLEAGLITKETFDEGMRIKDYVPGLRYFDEDELAGAPDAKGGRDGRSRIVNRFRGSMRDVINPLESLMADAYETAMAIARNDAIKALASLADRVGNDGGKIAERIPSHKLTAMTIDPLEALESAGKAAGLSAPDRALLGAVAEAAIGDAKAMLFRPAMITPNGDPVVFFREGGEIKALQLADGEFGRDMVAAFNMMTRDERSWWINWLAKPAAVLRAGITTHPTFILANLIRDQTMAWVFYGKPFVQAANLFAGVTDELMGREAARGYNAMGGIMGGENASAVRGVAYNRDIQAAGKAGFFWKSTTSLQGALAMTELSETATRLQLYRRFTDEAQARGLSRPEAMLEGAWRARDHLDFDRRGSGMAALARVIPFLNATLQGTDKTARLMFGPFVKKLRGDVLTADEAAQLGESAKAWARLGLLTVGGVALHALSSRHDDYEEYDPQLRAAHWVVPLKDGSDTALAIPKPFELAVVLNAGEAVWDAWVKHDPTAAERYREGLFTVIAPPSVIEDNPLIKYYWEVKTNRDTFRDRALVPDHLLALEPFLQYTSRTSEIGKAVGMALDVSPILVDHLVTSFGGTWGRTFLSLSDQASGEKPDYGWWDAVGTRRFIKDASRNSTSQRALWDLVSRTDGQYSRVAETYKAMAQNGDPDGAIAFLARQDRSARAYATVAMMEAKVKRMHPLNRARDAVGAINAVRKDLINKVARSADGAIEFTRADMTAADDILSDLAVAEARNALITVGAPGFAKVRAPIPIDTYWRELEAVAPSIAKALADAYATKKVYKADIVHKHWPDVERALLKDGTRADVVLETADGAYGGYEFDGARIKPRERPSVQWPDD
jgi:hypothetical protein